jgi:hypothetical protein
MAPPNININRWNNRREDEAAAKRDVGCGSQILITEEKRQALMFIALQQVTVTVTLMRWMDPLAIASHA